MLASSCKENVSLDIIAFAFSWFCNNSIVMHHAVFVPPFIFSVKGHWSEWRESGVCSAGCGYGVQRLVRECDNPRPVPKNNGCEGNKQKIKQCFVQPCPGECLVLVNHMVTRGWLIYYTRAQTRGHTVTGLV